jgi:GalNAc-alpha-(1->4)-GalNAc-alpha-(1->3)-diNAcBac-PP-undecaprenol alpha-1,4-N-acetyl-D-galactosaminyltransferase
MKKILLINNGLGGGGTERTSTNLANYFSDLGYSVFLLALYKSNHFYSLNHTVIFKEPAFSRDKFNRQIYLMKLLIYIRQNLKSFKPDTVLSFNEWTNPFVLLASFGLDIPIYVSDRMSPNAKLPFVTFFLQKMLYGKAKGIIAQTEYAKQIIAKKTASGKIVVIPNPLNAIPKISCEEKNRIITVGRLERVKGHKFLIQAFSNVKDKSWELSIVGDGSERSNLETLASCLGIRDRVLFHGHLNDFSLQLSESKIFVLPSLNEGFPNSLIEAMSVPLACVCSYYNEGVGEIINGSNGIIVEKGNVDELTNALDLLIQNRNLRSRLSSNAYKVHEIFKFENIAAQYLRVIGQHLNKQNNCYSN